MTPQQAQAMKALLTLIEALREAVKEAGPEGIPSGHLYAMINSIIPCGLATYTTAINLLIEAGKVTQKNHLLTYNA